MEGDFLNWAVDLLERIDEEPEKRRWCRNYSVCGANSGQAELERMLWRFTDQSYQLGLVAANYDKIIRTLGIDEDTLKEPDVGRLTYLETLACVSWHFRRDHFSEGSLVRESIGTGVMLRLLRHLRELHSGPCIVTTLATSCRCACTNIPESSGVYQVLAPKGMEIAFLDGGDSPTAYPVDVLRKKYAACKDKAILYIGKAGGRRGLRQRVWQYLRFGVNGAGNHRGGRAIWQIENADMLLLTYECCENCEERERQLLRDYRKENNGQYPLANWRE